MPEAQPVFVLLMSPEGRVTWQSKLPMAELLLVLERVKLDIVQGKVKQDTYVIVPPTNGDVSAVHRLLR